MDYIASFAQHVRNMVKDSRCYTNKAAVLGVRTLVWQAKEGRIQELCAPWTCKQGCVYFKPNKYLWNKRRRKIIILNLPQIETLQFPFGIWQSHKDWTGDKDGRVWIYIWKVAKVPRTMAWTRGDRRHFGELNAKFGFLPWVCEVLGPGVTKLGCLLLPNADSLGLLYIVEKNNKLACRPRKGMRLKAGFEACCQLGTLRWEE